LLFRFAALEMAMIERNEIFVSARDAEAIAVMLGAHRRANPFEADASDQLADRLAEARLVPADAMPEDRVALHSTVTYDELPSCRRRSVTLVLPADADAARARISVLSPIGLALIGRERGAVIEVAAPNGRALSIRIVDTVHRDHPFAKAA
jgi:regulator of nucleoside diphosphate kinase